MPPDRFQYDLYRLFAPLVAIVLMILLAASLSRGRRRRPEARIFSIYTLAAIGFLIANTLEICSKRPGSGLFWSRVIYLFIGFLPITWLEFCLRFTRGGHGMPKAAIAALAVIPFATLIVVFDDDLMRLMWSSITWIPQDPWIISTRKLGPWFAIFATYTYSLYLVGVFLVLRAFILYRQNYRRQATLVSLAIAMPFIASLFYVFKPIPGLVKDLTPLGYAVASILLYAGLFRQELFAFSPVARGLVVERMREGVIVVDAKRRVVDLNPAAISILGLSEASVGRRLEDLEDNQHLASVLIETLETASPREFFLESSGEPRWYLVESLSLGPGSATTLITVRDQTETKNLLNRIAEMASTDELTRLPNRRSFMREAARELSRAKRHGLRAAMAMFDLDHFKQVNDSYGHHSGDLTLQTFGRILLEEIRGEDVAGRIGGEEFAMIFVGAEGGGAGAFCERIRARLEKTEILDEIGRRIAATVSAGYAVMETGESVDVEILLSRADKALYAAKEKGRNRVERWIAEGPSDLPSEIQPEEPGLD